MGITVVNGDAIVKSLPEASYEWPGGPGLYVSSSAHQPGKLVFRSAHRIGPLHSGHGIKKCVYRVNGREFTDLSFLKGETLEEFPGDYEIRRHADGTVFLFSYIDVPTFDSGDRDWDSANHTAVYADEEGINLIHCRHGYGIPGIEVYTGLTRLFPAFSEWLNRLGCGDRAAGLPGATAGS